MPIDDPRAVRFCNEGIRPEADSLAQAYFAAKNLLQIWGSQRLDTLIPPDPAAVVSDGAPADGRSVISGALVQGMMQFVAGIVERSETPDPATGVRPIDVITAI